MRRYRMTNPTQFVKATLTLFLTVVLLLTAILAYTGSLISEASQIQSTIEYQVKSGDTLWHIAKTIQSPIQDIREIVHDIKSLNQLDSHAIYPGQIILIPGGEPHYEVSVSYQ